MKKKVGNKAQVESSICNAYLLEEISNFCSFYFEKDVDSKVRDLGLGRHEDNSSNMDMNLPEIFSSSIGYSSSQGQLCYLDEKDYKIAHRYVLTNCEILEQYERYLTFKVSYVSIHTSTSITPKLLSFNSLFEAHIKRIHGYRSSNEVWTKYEDEYTDWFKEYVSGLFNAMLVQLEH